jgi:DNA-binding FrmR family transcriptional regulator
MTPAATPPPVELSDAERERRRPVVNRLRRANGQLTALVAAVESGVPCRDIIIQLAAVRAALDRAGFAIIASGMRSCLVPEDATAETADLSVEEMEQLFMMLA